MPLSILQLGTPSHRPPSDQELARQQSSVGEYNLDQLLPFVIFLRFTKLQEDLIDQANREIPREPSAP